MDNRTDLEHTKFALSSWNVVISAVSGVGPATAVFDRTIDDLEKEKFTLNWEIRTITTF